jgi:hypothetical protein
MLPIPEYSLLHKITKLESYNLNVVQATTTTTLLFEMKQMAR